MSKVVLDFSMSLDGFITGLNGDLERLHAWMFREDATDRTAEILAEFFKTTGASVMGRRMWYEVDGPNGWGPGGWSDTNGTPLPFQVFVLTHEGRAPATKGKTTFTFVTDGVESALRQAKAAAGDRNVVLQGASIVQQYLVAGVVDEIRIHLVPVLLGTGIRLFEHLSVKPIELESIDVIDTPGVTHLQYRVVKDK